LALQTDVWHSRTGLVRVGARPVGRSGVNLWARGGVAAQGDTSSPKNRASIRPEHAAPQRHRVNDLRVMIYEFYGRFGPFHVASLISLATVGAGFVPVYLRRPRAVWMPLHATFMCWSYVGLLAAFVSEIAVRVPGVGFGSAVIAATVVVVAGGAILIHTRVPRIVMAVAKTRAV
jgi:predicted membrane protein DUF2306